MFPSNFRGKSGVATGCGDSKTCCPSVPTGSCTPQSGHVTCATPDCSSQGALIPVAYWPQAGTDDEPLIDLIATRFVRKGVQLAFRFYPQNEGYMSSYSATISFVLSQNLFPGRIIRVVVSSSNLLFLYARTQGETSWTQIAAPTGNPSWPLFASVYVFFGQYSACGCVPAAPSPVCALGLTFHSPPILPPTSVLSCKYSYAVTVSGEYPNFYVRTQSQRVPGNWDFGLWQLAKWGGWITLEATAASYATDVGTYEDSLSIVLTPGQLLPIGFKPYIPVRTETSVPQLGEIALVVTRKIDVGTIVRLYPNSWNYVGALTNFAFQWSYPLPTLSPSPPNVPDVIPGALKPGTVLHFSLLGSTGAVQTNIGTLTKGLLSSPDDGITSVTIYSIWPDLVQAISAVYTCSYTGPFPEYVTAGEDERFEPWPDTGGIIASVSGRPCVKTQGALCTRERLNAEPLVAWIDQIPPASLPL